MTARLTRRSLAGALFLATLAPTVMAQSAASVVSEQQLRKILDIMGAAGAIRPIGPEVVAMLGIGHDDDVLTCVQITYSTDPKREHTIGKLERGLGYILSAMGAAEVRHIYYVDNDLLFRRAVDISAKLGVTTVADEVARPELEAELAFWAKAADADFK